MEFLCFKFRKKRTGKFISYDTFIKKLRDKKPEDAKELTTLLEVQGIQVLKELFRGRTLKEISVVYEDAAHELFLLPTPDTRIYFYPDGYYLLVFYRLSISEDASGT